MGLLVTLYLITSNVYGSVEAPDSRGFSYIEIWMVGAQFPILLALCEYGIILWMKKRDKKPKIQNGMVNIEDSESDLDDWIKKLDFATMTFSFFGFLLFSTIYLLISIQL